MPYKDPQKQKEAVRTAVQKVRKEPVPIDLDNVPYYIKKIADPKERKVLATVCESLGEHAKNVTLGYKSIDMATLYGLIKCLE